MSKRLVHLYRYLTDEECRRFKMPTILELETNRSNGEIIDTKDYITYDEIWIDESQMNTKSVPKN